jgi:hypothetical protein
MVKKVLGGFLVFIFPLLASPNADAQKYCEDGWNACNTAVYNWGPFCLGSTACRNGVCGTFGPDNTDFGQKRVTVCQTLWATHAENLFSPSNWKNNQNNRTFCNLVSDAIQKQKLCKNSPH